MVESVAEQVTLWRGQCWSAMRRKFFEDEWLFPICRLDDDGDA
jgi:hypothetical protein